MAERGKGRAAAFAPGTARQMPGVLAECAREAGLSFPGLVVRVALRSVLLLPHLVRGAAPLVVKAQFLPLVALRRTLAGRLAPDRVRERVGLVLQAAATDKTAANFGEAMRDPAVGTIGACYERVHRGAGRHQAVRYERRGRDSFCFTVTDCAFVRALRELGLADVAWRMCEADRVFWDNVLRGRGVIFSKTEETIALGGSGCRSSFAAACRATLEPGRPKGGAGSLEEVAQHAE